MSNPTSGRLSDEEWAKAQVVIGQVASYFQEKCLSRMIILEEDPATAAIEVMKLMILEPTE